MSLTLPLDLADSPPAKVKQLRGTNKPRKHEPQEEPLPEEAEPTQATADATATHTTQDAPDKGIPSPTRKVVVPNEVDGIARAREINEKYENRQRDARAWMD